MVAAPPDTNQVTGEDMRVQLEADGNRTIEWDYFSYNPDPNT